MWVEQAVSYCTVLAWNLPAGDKESHEEPTNLNFRIRSSGTTCRACWLLDDTLKQSPSVVAALWGQHVAITSHWGALLFLYSLLRTAASGWSSNLLPAPCPVLLHAFSQNYCLLYLSVLPTEHWLTLVLIFCNVLFALLLFILHMYSFIHSFFLLSYIFPYFFTLLHFFLLSLFPSVLPHSCYHFLLSLTFLYLNFLISFYAKHSVLSICFSLMPQVPAVTPSHWVRFSLFYSLALWKKLRGLSPRANYTDRAAAAGRRS